MIYIQKRQKKFDEKDFNYIKNNYLIIFIFRNLFNNKNKKIINKNISKLNTEFIKLQNFQIINSSLKDN